MADGLDAPHVEPKLPRRRRMNPRSWPRRAGVLPPRIFISYRRTDSGGHSSRLRAALKERYGDRSVFIDHASIDTGEEFARELESALAEAEVVLVIIGDDWITTEKDGKRRLDDPEDWVRREIESALGRRSVRVFPVLVGDAELPDEQELPKALRPLLKHQATEVRVDRFDDDTDNLASRIGGWRTRRLARLGVGVAAIVALFLVFLSQIPTIDDPPIVTSPEAITLTFDDTRDIDLLATATDDRDHELSLSHEGVSANGGTITRLEDGVVRYTPADEFTGADDFGYAVIDSSGGAGDGIVTFTVLPGEMRGRYRIAVAEFSRDDDVDPAEVDTTEISEIVAKQIDAELEQLNATRGYDFRVRHPDLVGPIDATANGDLTKAALELAERIDADLVVYGHVSEQGLDPAFYLRDRIGNLQDAEELSGQYPLGSKILGSELRSGGMGPGGDANIALRSRSQALAHFIVGLSYVAVGDFEKARDFLDSVDIEAWRPTDGREILHHFKGLVAGNLDDLETAHTEFEAALSIDEDFARALIGRATVAFHRSRGSCRPGDIDAGGLRASEADFRRALADDDQPAISNIGPKASFGLGRLYYCMSQSGVETLFDEAEALHNSVVDEYEGGNDGIGYWAAESYQDLALLALPVVGDSDPGPSYCEALAAFEKALETSTTDAQRTRFEGGRAFARERVEATDTECG